MEQPQSSRLFDHQPWPAVTQHRRTVQITMHQCQTGAKSKHGRYHVKKPTTFWASDYDLVCYLDGLVCGTLPRRCNGQHITLRGSEASAAQVWPWDLAQRIPWGVLKLLHRRRWQDGYMLASNYRTGAAVTCPGCRAGRSADHPHHGVNQAARFANGCRSARLSPKPCERGAATAGGAAIVFVACYY